MDIQGPNKKKMSTEANRNKISELQKQYVERLERFMTLVELSYALKTAPRITNKK